MIDYASPVRAYLNGPFVGDTVTWHQPGVTLPAKVIEYDATGDRYLVRALNYSAWLRRGEFEWGGTHV